MFAGTCSYGQKAFENLTEAQSFISLKLQNASNPGKTYQQTLNYEAGRNGLVTLVTTVTDSKGKVSSPSTTFFFIEHIDQKRIDPISSTKEYKLRVFNKGNEKLFKRTKDNKSMYVNSIDFYCSDSQDARDVEDALNYLINHSIADKINITSEKSAYNWLQDNVKQTFLSNGITYDISLSLDQSNNKLSYSITSTNAKNLQNQMRYEFYLKDFNIYSFKATEKTNKAVSVEVVDGDTVKTYYISDFDINPFNLNTINNQLSVKISTTDKAKPIMYFENDVQKSYLSKFDLIIDDPKLAEDILSVFDRIKTGKYDKEIKKKNESDNSMIKFTSTNLKDYCGKKYIYAVVQHTDYLVLNTDKTYVLYPEGDGGFGRVNTGTFQEKNGFLVLTSKKCYSTTNFDTEPTGKEKGESIDCGNNFGKNIKIELISDDQSLYYSQFIKVTADCSNKEFDNCLDGRIFSVPGMEVKVGELRKKGTVDVEIMGMKKGITNTSVKLRETPSANGKIALFETEGDEIWYDTKTLDAVPDKSEVIIIAKTTKKEKFNKVDGYWYLVNIGYFTKEVWVHSQYIKFDN